MRSTVAATSLPHFVTRVPLGHHSLVSVLRRIIISPARRIVQIVKQRLEKERDLEGIDLGNIMSGGRRSRAGNTATVNYKWVCRLQDPTLRRHLHACMCRVSDDTRPKATLPSDMSCVVSFIVCTTSVTGPWAGRNQTRTVRTSGPNQIPQRTAAAPATQTAARAMRPVAPQPATGYVNI